MTGAGVLGFGSVTKTMLNTGETATENVLEWDVNKWIPKKTKSINVIGGMTSSVETIYEVENIGKTYFSYEKLSTVTDMYNEKVKTYNTYDKKKGVLISQRVTNIDKDMYKQVDYSDYIEKSGVWLPGVITIGQKHEHDANEFSTATKYQYDNKGNIISTTVHSGTDLAITTNCTYDEYGNCVSSYSTGKSVKKITKFREYDSTGRFVIKNWQDPEATVMTYTYDLWGNVLTEKDCTDSDNILTTSHTYDNWGRRTSTTLPDERKVKYTTGWGDSYKKHHFSFVEESGRPWELTWYDKAGNETLYTTFGPQNVLIQKTTEYYNNGKLWKISEQIGKLKSWKSYVYDDLGRVITETSSLGKEVKYKYENRKVTTTTNGREFTKTTDHWGNVLSSTDPSEANVSYVYGSNGLPSSITTDGSTVKISYDCAGNKISVSDPDGGITKYEYSADGLLLNQTDAKGVKTINQYDELGRLSIVKIGDQTIKNYYGTSGTEKLRLIRKQSGLNYIRYTYDKYGRVKTETRYIANGGTYSTNYSYNSNNQLSSVIYPGISLVKYSYDDYGFKNAVGFNGKEIYRLLSYDGLTTKTSFADSIVFTRTVDSNGLERGRQLHYAAKELDHYLVEFDSLTLNLKSRERMGNVKENFLYDNLDRLTGVRMGTREIMNISYARNGNILSKTGLGNYNYNNSYKPHAVSTVENSGEILPSGELLTSFNCFGLIEKIEDTESNRSMQFLYGPDMQRWMSAYFENGKSMRAIQYANNLEIIQENVGEKRIYYLDENVILIKQNNNQELLFLFKDHLGSILSGFNINGIKKFDATYDAWGKQTIKTNPFGLRRGYTGHEMINEFGIINMNGRLYDPALGRFFSPDPYIQFPDYSQSYNRYSYCLNNPLKYTDPSGQFLEGFALVAAMSIFKVGSSMLRAHATGGNILKAGLASLLTSPLCSYGIGKLYGGCGSVGKELLRAGTHGMASGLASVMDGGNFGSFASGFISGGAAASFLSGKMKGLTPDDPTDTNKTNVLFKAALIGGGAALMTGGNFLRGAMIGYNIAAFNYLEGETVVPENEFSDTMDIARFAYYSGHVCAELQDVNIYTKVPTWLLNFNDFMVKYINFESNINTVYNGVGNSLNKEGYNSTIGSNGKFYWKIKGEKGFYGNQYVTAQRLTTIGEQIAFQTGKTGNYIAAAQIGYGAVQDYLDYKYYGYTDGYHAVHAAGSFAGAVAGMKAGFALGSALCAPIGGVGAIPGGIICSAVLGIAGAFCGGEIGGEIVDWIYGKY